VLTADATDCAGAADLEATGAVVGVAVAVAVVAVEVFAAVVGGLGTPAATVEMLLVCMGACLLGARKKN